MPKLRGVWVLAVLVAAGCEMKGENVPLDQAMYRVPPEPMELTTVRHPDAPPAPVPPPVVIFDRQWMAHGAPQRIQAQLLRQVGAAQGVAFYAATWDQPPYARLLASVGPDMWLEYRETAGGPAMTHVEPHE
jgi:hypothetical protein